MKNKQIVLNTKDNFFSAFTIYLFWFSRLVLKTNVLYIITLAGDISHVRSTEGKEAALTCIPLIEL